MIRWDVPKPTPSSKRARDWIVLSLMCAGCFGIALLAAFGDSGAPGLIGVGIRVLGASVLSAFCLAAFSPVWWHAQRRRLARALAVHDGVCVVCGVGRATDAPCAGCGASLPPASRLPWEVGGETRYTTLFLGPIGLAIAAPTIICIDLVIDPLATRTRVALMVACAAFWVMKFARPAFVALSKEGAKFRRGSVVVGQCVLLGEGPSLSGKVRVTATLAREGLSLKGVTTETVVRSGESTPPMDLPEMESLAALLAAGVSRGALEVTATRRFPWNAGAPRSAAAERVLGAAYREGAPVSREESPENVSATVRVLQRGARTTLATVLGDPAAEALCAPLEGADDEEDANEDFAFAFPSVPLGRLIARVHSDASVRASVRRAVGGIEAVSPVALAAVRRALRFAGEA